MITPRRFASLPSLPSLVAASLGLLVAALGCGGEGVQGAGGSTSATTSTTTSASGATGGGGGAGGGRPTPPPLPVIPNHGGPIVAHPEVVTVTWQADPLTADLVAFDTWLVQSTFFTTMMAEWGVGVGTYGGGLVVPASAPASLDDNAIRALLQDAITNGTLPPANGSRIYTVYPPSGTKVVNFGEGCVAFQAYHSAFTASLPGGGTGLAIYAVTPRCAQTQGLTPTDYTTWGASHEVMEASSDPDPLMPAWVILQQTDLTPQVGENADLCAGHPMKAEGHLVTRNYSNVAAKAGQRPCVPAPAGPMFGAFASPGAIAIKPGATTTVPIDLYADGPLPAFNVSVLALDPALTATVDKTQGVDGDVLTLTVTAKPGFVEIPGQNLVRLAATSNGYSTFRFVIVHRQ